MAPAKRKGKKRTNKLRNKGIEIVQSKGSQEKEERNGLLGKNEKRKKGKDWRRKSLKRVRGLRKKSGMEVG